MSKKNILKTLDNSSYVSIVLGAVLVLFFEIFAKLLILKFAIIAFAASFLILLVFSVMKLYFLIHETKENDELLVDKQKESKAWIIVRLSLSIVLFVLMITFLCIY